MKLIFSVLVVLLPLIALGEVTDEKIELILKDDAKLTEYFNCLMDISPTCPKGGDTIKGKIVDVLETNCKSCTDAKREQIWKVIVFLKKEKPDLLKQLLDKYDPTGKYKSQYGPELQKRL